MAFPPHPLHEAIKTAHIENLAALISFPSLVYLYLLDWFLILMSMTWIDSMGGSTEILLIRRSSSALDLLVDCKQTLYKRPDEFDNKP